MIYVFYREEFPATAVGLCDSDVLNKKVKQLEEENLKLKVQVSDRLVITQIFKIWVSEWPVITKYSKCGSVNDQLLLKYLKCGSISGQ